MCNLHLRSVVRRHDEIQAAGIREVVVFHSSKEDLQAYAGGFPLAMIADPDKRLYAEFGVESAPRALLNPRGWPVSLRSVLCTVCGVIRGREHVPPINPRGGRFGLPADFLIASDGRLIACKYGDHLYDQWSVDEILSLAKQKNPASIEA